jgi:hypothetical protein
MMDDGIIKICDLTNLAPDGDMPMNQLTVLDSMYFGSRTVGYNRQYAAKGVNEQVDMLVRVWRNNTVHIGMFAVLTNYEGQVNESGDQYRIDNVQHLLDDDGLKVTDLTLSRMDELYEIADSNNQTSA